MAGKPVTGMLTPAAENMFEIWDLQERAQVFPSKSLLLTKYSHYLGISLSKRGSLLSLISLKPTSP